MTETDLARRRLYSQRLAGSPFAHPEAAVQALGAVQSQDYGGAKWAVAQRTESASDAALDQALADGAILRTHVLRPTWHFVAPADIRWLLALTAPRVHALNAYYYRASGLDQAVFNKSNETLARTLQGGRQATRAELVAALKHAGIVADTLLAYTLLLMRAELDAVICSGALRGKQHTYALLDERAPQARVLARDAALAELARRYFTSHGPATLRDFVWWSGLTAADAKRGIEFASSQLARENMEGEPYWFSPSYPPAASASPTAYLLPNFDEFTVGYADRRAISATMRAQGLATPPFVLLGYVIVLDGQIVGTWKRTLKRDAVVIEPTLFRRLDEAERQALAGAAERYAAFISLPAQLQLPA